MSKYYDVVIVGGGPSSLALAQCCSSLNKKVIIIEKENTIGGCHRVRRVPFEYNKKIENLFTEHGPRIYVSGSKVFKSLLKDLDLSFDDFFTPYNFSITEIGGKTIWNTLNFRELLSFTFAFISLFINPNYGKKISVKDFCIKNAFKEDSIIILDKICRLTDGATSDNYTLYQFLQLFNQHLFNQIYQPKLPNDIGLFRVWKQSLQSRGVDFLLNEEVKNLLTDESNRITSVKLSNDTIIKGDLFVLAIPPVNLISILQNSNIINAFGDFELLNKWTLKTQYIDYISITFHWDQDLDLKKIHGFPKTEWGIVFIVLSDYMKFNENCSKTVISTAITVTDVKSKSDKLPDECSKSDLIQEVLLQIKSSYPDLPNPTASLLSPGVIYDSSLHKWISKDTAFIATSNQPFLEPQSSYYKNLYSLGTHNGKHLYNFTSIESAVTNGVSLSHSLYPILQNHYKISRSIEVTDLIFYSVLLIILFYLVK
jgi:hypothetical protein